jgi:DNA-binding LacI/PurR family transcriptional regulator
MLDGLVVLGDIQPEMQDEIYKTFPSCVWVDVNVNKSDNCIQRDEIAAGKLVGSKLVEAGYRDVIWICRDPSDAVAHYSLTHRLAGLHDAMGTKDKQAVIHTAVAVEQTVKELDSILAGLTPKTAVVTYNTALSMAVINWAISKQKLPGRDFSLVSPDDSLPLHEMDSIISRVHFDRLAMGQQAVGLLLKQMASEPTPSITMPVQWIEGSTLRQCPED